MQELFLKSADSFFFNWRHLSGALNKIAPTKEPIDRDSGPSFAPLQMREEPTTNCVEMKSRVARRRREQFAVESRVSRRERER